MIKTFLLKIKAIFDGLFTVFKHSFKKRVTLEYPEKHSNLSERFRGKHLWNSKKCLACKICERVCPVDAIKIDKNEDEIKFNIDYTKCIFCGNCQYYCKASAITMSNDFELATDNKADLNVEICSNESNKDSKEVL